MFKEVATVDGQLMNYAIRLSDLIKGHVKRTVTDEHTVHHALDDRRRRRALRAREDDLPPSKASGPTDGIAY